MKSNCTSMKEMQQLMAALREVYTDVRLLDAETLQQIQEGARTDPHGPDFCYACRHKDRFSHETAMRMILNGECGAFNPLLLECLTDIQAELQEKLQNIAVNR